MQLRKFLSLTTLAVSALFSFSAVAVQPTVNYPLGNDHRNRRFAFSTKCGLGRSEKSRHYLCLFQSDAGHQ